MDDGRNAIQVRLGALETQWNEFALRPGARLLRWLVQADETKMVDAFLQVQASEHGSTPDLFLVLEEPFRDPASYAAALIAALRERYDTTRPALQAAGVEPAWRCPDPAPGATPALMLCAAACSLIECHGRLFDRVVLALTPPAPPPSWSGFLSELVRSPAAERLRFVVTDRADAESLDALAAAQPEVVVTLRPDLDMPGAVEELLAAIPGGGPSHAFRRFFMGLLAAAGKGDLTGAGTAAATALAIATEQGWAQMQVVVHMALGSARLGAGLTDQAIESYRAAGAVSAGQPSDPVAPKLSLQARLAEGSALVSAGRFARAAPVYESAADLAGAAGEPLFVMEAWRLAAYCHEQAGDHARAWSGGLRALDAAALLPPDLRASSTLSFVEEGLLRVARERAQRPPALVRVRMRALTSPQAESVR